jgi:hypothetical protein
MNQMELYSYLSRQRYGVVSSLAENGSPQSALVGIAISPQLEIIFDTVKNSRKYPNLIARPSCSLVIGWEAEQTVQLEGTAKEPRGSELQRYQSIYFSAWPDGPTRAQWPQIAYFAIEPRWIRYSDFAQRPPLIAEFSDYELKAERQRRGK